MPSANPKNPAFNHHYRRGFDSVEPLISVPEDHTRVRYGILSFVNMVTQIKKVYQTLTANGTHAEPNSKTNLLDILRTYTSKSTKSNNCSELSARCINNTLLFSSMDTLASCVTLSVTASLYQHDRATISQLGNDTSNAVAQELAKLGVSDLGTFDGKQVLESLVSCAVAGCRDSSLSGGEDCNPSTLRLGDLASSIGIGVESLGDVYDGLLHYCDGVAPDVNADIAGPGVVVSYVVQCLLGLALYIVAKLVVSWIPASRAFYHRLVKVGKGLRAEKPSQPGETSRGRPGPFAALFFTLVDFQEVQVLFVLAIQLATLATLSAPSAECGYSWSCPAINSVPSFSEALLNAELIRGPAINGVLPVLLTQTTLQRAGLRWSYTLALTALVCALAAAIQWLPGRAGKPPGMDFESLWEHLRAARGVDRCGRNPSLQVYCLATLAKTDDVSTRLPGLLVSCVALPWLVADRMFRLETGRQQWPGSGDSMLNMVTRLGREIVWVTLQGVLVMGVIVYLSGVAQVASGVGFGSSAWTYGQLIAVMVWVPILVNWGRNSGLWNI